MRAAAFDWADEQTLARSTNSSRCIEMMEQLAILKEGVVIERRFYRKLLVWRQRA
jgi:hypothetical protein